MVEFEVEELVSCKMKYEKEWSPAVVCSLQPLTVKRTDFFWRPPTCYDEVKKYVTIQCYRKQYAFLKSQGFVLPRYRDFVKTNFLEAISKTIPHVRKGIILYKEFETQWRIKCVSAKNVIPKNIHLIDFDTKQESSQKRKIHPPLAPTSHSPLTTHHLLIFVGGKSENLNKKNWKIYIKTFLWFSNKLFLWHCQ